MKSWFGKKKEAEREYTIDDLIVLERYEEAEVRLRDKMRMRDDIHDHLKLADVYVALRQVQKAVDEYVYVAETYADDGFYDKAIAAVTKARRLNPMDDTLPARIAVYERRKKLERSRAAALEGFLKGREGSASQGTAVVEFQKLWKGLVDTELVRSLTGEQLALLFQAVDVTTLATGKPLVERGGQDPRLFLIVEGELVAELPRPEARPVDLKTFSSGQIVGEAALFQKSPWPATYRVGSRLTVLSIDEKGLETCLTGNPDPRGFLDLLRRQQNDRAVADAAAKVEG